VKERNLVICCAGDQSLHQNWSGAGREFDLLLVYYGDTEGRWRDSADYYLATKGPKWHLVHHASQVFSGEISQYGSIWIPDDDIDSDTDRINRLFRCFNRYSLALAQPALTRNSYISHKITREKKLSFLRYTNFVEIMAPMMRVDVFMRLSEYFMLNASGWGLDYLWAAIIENEELGRIAIADRCAVTHTRPVNPKAGFYATMNIDPYQEYEHVIKVFGLSTRPRVYRTLFEIAGYDFSVGALNVLDRLPKAVTAEMRSMLRRR
jgi:hypothetical protein